MTGRIVLRAAGLEAGRPDPNSPPDLMMLQGAPRTGIAAKTRPRPAAGPASFPVDRPLYLPANIPWLRAKMNSIRFLTGIFYVRAKKLFFKLFFGVRVSAIFAISNSTCD